MTPSATPENYTTLTDVTKSRDKMCVGSANSPVSPSVIVNAPIAVEITIPRNSLNPFGEDGDGQHLTVVESPTARLLSL
jgi:hypothetical protein